MTSEASRQGDIDSAYEKLFYGNNLPAVTPDGASFHPLLSDGERAALRALLRNAVSGAEDYLS